MSEMNTIVVDSEEIQNDSLSWLLKMELVDDPVFKNALLLNIYKVDDRIEDVELLFDTRFKRLLIYIKLGILVKYTPVKQTFWEKLRKKQRPPIEERDLENEKKSNQEIFYAIEGIVGEALPAYKFRVIGDYAVFQQALKIRESNERKIKT